jgi:hypothetical protein
MINVYDVKADRMFNSINFLSKYYKIPASKIKASIDQGKVLIGNKEYEFRSSKIKPDPKQDFIRNHKLKLMIQNFYMSPSGTVYLWASKKKSWMKWSVSTRENGNRYFKATIISKGRRYSKWIRADKYQESLFGR